MAVRRQIDDGYTQLTTSYLEGSKITAQIVHIFFPVPYIVLFNYVFVCSIYLKNLIIINVPKNFILILVF